MWFKEYTFNVIIQPFHLILYTVLVGSAIELATISLVYAVIAIYFLIPAEKLLRKFFGFDNAGTLSAAGSFAGGAVFSAMISKLNRPKPKDDKEEEKPKNLRKNSKAGHVNAEDVLTGPGGAGSLGGSSGIGGSGGPKPAGGSPIVGPGGTPISSGNGSPFGYSSKGVPADLRKKVLPHGAFSILRRKGLSGIGEGIGDATRSMGYRMYRGAINGVKKMPKKAFRLARRGTIGALGGGTAALLAAGAMAASGDPSKAFSTAMAAGVAGASFGNYYGDKFSKGVGGLAGTGKDAFWGKDAKDLKQYRFDQAFLKDPNTIDTLSKYMDSRDDAIAAIKDGSVQAFLKNNITDSKKIGKALTYQKKFMAKGMSPDQALEKAVAVAQWSRDINPGVFSPKSNEQMRWKQNMLNSGVSSKDVEDLLSQMEDIYNT